MDVNVKDAIDRIAQLSEVKMTSIARPVGSAIPVLSAPAGVVLHSVKKFVDEFAIRPDRRIGTDKLQDVESLIEWTNRHADDGTVIFCDTTHEAPRLLSIIDYHLPIERDEQGKEVGKNGDDTARYRAFRGLYEFPLAKQWKAWTEIDGTPMTQVDLAEFLDDHALDLIAPDSGTDSAGNDVQKLPAEVAQYLAYHGGRCALPNDVITLAKGLEITANRRAVQKVDMQSGTGGLLFEEEHSGSNGTKLDIPKLFMIAVPLFDKSPFQYRVPIRLRYRLGPPLMWTLTMFGADDIVEKAIKETAEHVKQGTAATLFYGVPA